MPFEHFSKHGTRILCWNSEKSCLEVVHISKTEPIAFKDCTKDELVEYMEYLHGSLQDGKNYA
jgi:hypothetical protein